MDAKSKANFINSVVNSQTISCPKCGTVNKPEKEFCISCGTILPQNIASIQVPESAADVAPINDETSMFDKKQKKYVESTLVFAQGLPSWDIVPPQVIVRRH